MVCGILQLYGLYNSPEAQTDERHFSKMDVEGSSPSRASMKTIIIAEKDVVCFNGFSGYADAELVQVPPPQGWEFTQSREGEHKRLLEEPF